MSDPDPTPTAAAEAAFPESGNSGKPQQEHRCPRSAELDAMIGAEDRSKRVGRKSPQKPSPPAAPDVQEQATASVVAGLARKRTDLGQVVGQFSSQLRRDFASEIAADPKGFKKRVVHWLRRSLPPFAGRPSEASITNAINLRLRGETWKQVYPQLIPSHSAMDAAVRRLAESNLRAAVRSRRNARRRRKHRRQSSAEAKLALNVPPRQGHEPDLNWGPNHEEAHRRPTPGPQGEGRPLRP